MGTHTLDELLRLYTLEKITVEQAMGQVLQHLQQITATLQEMDAAQQRMEQLEQEIKRLKAFVGMEEERKGKKKGASYHNESED
jgi:hypothetical protein